MEELFSKAKKYSQQNSLFKKGDKVLVAVSGGADSVTLLLFLHELSAEKNLQLAAAHLNYGTRGQDSEADEVFVKNLASRLGLTFFCKKTKLDKSASNFEMKARDIRYDFFSKLARREGCSKIAIGHNQNDQVETVLLNWLRGAGPKGLAGMQPVRDLFVRPLLNISRAQIEEYLSANKQSFREDKTNEDLGYRRNWIRHVLLPSLRIQVNNFDKRLLNLSNKFYLLSQNLEEEAEQVLNKLQVVGHQTSTYKLKPFLELPVLLQGEILRLLLGKKDLAAKHIAEVLDLLNNSESGKYKIFNKKRIEKKKDFFIVVDK